MDRLRKKRGIVRSAVTRTTNKIKIAIENESVTEVEELLIYLQEKAKELQDIDKDIETQVDEAELEDELEGAQEYDELISVWKVRGKKLLQLQAQLQPNPNLTQSPISSGSQQKVKLPKLEVKRFEGDFEKWQGFWDQFTSAIHSNTSLNAIDKFNYLKSLLGVQPMAVIEGLELTEANYQQAVDLLIERFGKKELLINAHMQRLLELSPIKDVKDVRGLRKLYDTCQTHIRGLQALDVKEETYGSLLCPILVRMFPKEIILECCRITKVSTTGDIKELMKFLQTELESRERVFSLLNCGTNNKFNRNPQVTLEAKSNKKSMTPTTTALFASAKERSTDGVRKEAAACFFCNEKDHRIVSCGIIKNKDERREKLRKLGRCFLCLGTQHMARTCPRRQQWSCSFCNGKHHRALCNQEGESLSAAAIDFVPVSESVVVSMSQEAKQSSSTVVLLQTAKVVLEASGRHIEARCLIDGGSQRSFVSSTLAQQLNATSTGIEALCIHRFGESEGSYTSCRRLKMKITGRTGKGLEMEFLEVPQISAALMTFPGDQLKRRAQQLSLLLADDSTAHGPASCEVLIGADCYWKIVTGRIAHLGGGLVAAESLFGWLVHGPLQSEAVCGTEVAHIMNIVTRSPEKETELLNRSVERFWQLEATGISATSDARKRSSSNQEVLAAFSRDIQLIDDRYEVRLPWNENKVNLRSNWKIAKSRLFRLVKRFSKDTDLWEKYEQAVLDYFTQNHSEDVSTTIEPEGIVYYVPHHAVIKEERMTTKVRVVFDASSHEEGQLALNDCLWAGPNLNPELLSILLRFRSYKVAVTADIEKAFLQVSLMPEDRDAVRFLWTAEDWKPGEKVRLRHFRMKRVPFGVSSSPFLLAATVRYHAKQYEVSHSTTSAMLDESLYVDDLLGGAESEDSAWTIYSEAKTIMDIASMPLKKWVSNSSELRRRWTEAGESQHPLKKVRGSEEGLKVLGLLWIPVDDEFRFDVSGVLEELQTQPFSKRSVLSIAARLFDPLGLLSPVVLTAKIVFQELWRREVQWDEELPLDIKQQWTTWCQELAVLNRVQVPRWYGHSLIFSSPEWQIHVFCDASPKAYGAVLYLRYQEPGSEVETILVTSKCRVAPLKQTTLPRLELLGALVGARLGHYTATALHMPISQFYFWTDSMIVLHWLRSKANQWKTFVSSRVEEIQELTKPCCWRHCHGKVNPADILTRGESPQKLVEDSCWWKGPQWLTLPENEWPELMINECSIEVVQMERNSTAALLAETVVCDPPEPLLDLSHFSSLARVLRVTAWIFRFKAVCRKQEYSSGGLSRRELWHAETYWIRVVQSQCFKDDLAQMKNGKPLSSHSSISHCSPYLDNQGILRVSGRLQKSGLSEDEKHPIILSSKHLYTTLLVQHCHKIVFHGGPRETWAQLRSQYWLLRGKQIVKKMIRGCLTCRKERLAAGSQIEAPLPRDRVVAEPAFQVTGLDFAGPLFVKVNQRTRSKVYIALFTCATTRAVHLELVSGLSTKLFLLALRRFFARRGTCAIIYSDNAQTFKRAEEELKVLWKSIDKSDLQDFFGQKGVQWKYIVACAPWWGGFWERMVRSVKQCLRRTLGRACLKFEELTTILTEIEAVLNSRPIIFVNDDEPPLTPSHFLTGGRLTSVPPFKEDAKVDNDIVKRWKYRERLLESFWKRWKHEYLLSLRQFHDVQKPKKVSLFEVDDLVIIHEPKIARHLWKTARVIEVTPGRDDIVRSCLLKTSSGKLIRRPIQLLYKLEV